MFNDTQLSENARGTCLSKIQSMAATNRRSALKIAKHILAYPEETLDLTISELAAKTDTAVGSVSRFCNQLGYENYRAFQIDLTASLNQNLSPISDIFSPDDDYISIIKRVYEINRRSLMDTEKLTSYEALDELAKLIIHSKRVFLVGVGGSGRVAHLGAGRFNSLGIAAFVISDPYEGLAALLPVTKDDVVIAISHSGRSVPVLELLKIAKGKGARTAGITNYSDSLIAQLCEFPLITSFRERRVNAAVSSSRIAQICVLDVLYFLAAHYLGSRAEQFAVEAEEHAEKLFRAKSMNK